MEKRRVRNGASTEKLSTTLQNISLGVRPIYIYKMWETRNDVKPGDDHTLQRGCKQTAAEIRMLDVEQNNTVISDGIMRSESERTSNLKVSSVTVNCRALWEMCQEGRQVFTDRLRKTLRPTIQLSSLAG